MPVDHQFDSSTKPEMVQCAQMGSKKKRNGECVYCGRKGKITYDHVPPQGLFANDDRANLVKVPCCEQSNQNASRDDEYFKFVLTTRGDVYRHPEVQELLPGVLRSLGDPHNVDLKIGLLRTLQIVRPRTPGGLVLPPRPAYKADSDRLERVTTRITRELFFHEKGYQVPAGYTVGSFAYDRIVHIDPAEYKGIESDLLMPLFSVAPRKIGREVFSYRVIFSDADHNSSGWLFVFYGEIVFVGLVVTTTTHSR